MEDSLGPLITEQIPPKDYPGIFASGATRSVILGANDTSVKAVVDLVVYADSTAEVLDEHAFSQIVAIRKGGLMAMQKLSEALHRVFEDATITNPGAAAVEELKRELVKPRSSTAPRSRRATEQWGCKAPLPTWRGITARLFFEERHRARSS